MDFKRISDLSFFSAEQKEWFKNYIIYNDGTVFNEKTGKNVAKTLHGIRGYVVNLSIYIDGVRKQRQVVIHRAMADLFIRPMKDGEKIKFNDDDKTNINLSNIEYIDTKKAVNDLRIQESVKESIKASGITEDGRICTACSTFKKWDEMAGNKTSICRACASKRGVAYQKSVNYSRGHVKYETYFERLKNDNPINVNGFLGVACTKCKDIFLLTRSKVLNRLKSLKLNHKTRPLVCEKCKKENTNEEI